MLGIEEFIRRRLVSSGYVSCIKARVLEMVPRKQNDDFLENGSNDFDYISVIYRDHLPK
jgi:hypothetical protein